jgi:hypothetical protein
LLRVELLAWARQQEAVAPTLADSLQAELLELAQSPELASLIELGLQAITDPRTT